MVSVREETNRDISGEATREEMLWLRSSEKAQDWLETLIDLHYDIHAQMIERNAARQSFHNECIRMGPTGKQKYFAYKDEYENWVAVATRRKARIASRVREARRAIREAGLQEHGFPVPSERISGASLAAREFLVDDLNISPESLTYRDRLVEEIDNALQTNEGEGE